MITNEEILKVRKGGELEGVLGKYQEIMYMVREKVELARNNCESYNEMFNYHNELKLILNDSDILINIMKEILNFPSTDNPEEVKSEVRNLDPTL